MKRYPIIDREDENLIRVRTAEIYHAEPLIVAPLRGLYDQFGLRAVSRAIRQLKSERYARNLCRKRNVAKESVLKVLNEIERRTEANR